ncbi:hypothetical protein D3C81_971230 [compost metagenome]
MVEAHDGFLVLELAHQLVDGGVLAWNDQILQHTEEDVEHGGHGCWVSVRCNLIRFKPIQVDVVLRVHVPVRFKLELEDPFLGLRITPHQGAVQVDTGHFTRWNVRQLSHEYFVVHCFQRIGTVGHHLQLPALFSAHEVVVVGVHPDAHGAVVFHKEATGQLWVAEVVRTHFQDVVRDVVDVMERRVEVIPTCHTFDQHIGRQGLQCIAVFVVHNRQVTAFVFVKRAWQDGDPLTVVHHISRSQDLVNGLAQGHDVGTHASRHFLDVRRRQFT